MRRFPTCWTGIAMVVVSLGAGSVAGARGEILTCPVQQPPVKNGAKPDPELFKTLVRCKKGEKRDDYVDAFGEWAIGSEEPVKSPEIKSIPKE